MSRLRSFFALAGLPSPRQTLVAFSVTLAAAAVLWGGLNYWKFGRVFTSIPMAIAYGHIPGTLESLFSFANFPSNMWAYFSPSKIRLATRFPWVDFSGLEVSSLVARFPHTLVKRVEPFASLSAAMPELLLAALAGTVLSFSRLRKELAPIRAPLIGGLAGCGLVFAWGLISYRYLHDLLPWLTFGSAIAIAFIPSIASRRMRYTVATLFVFGVSYSTCVNLWFGILEDRYYVVPRAPEKRIAFLDVGADVDGAGLRGLILNLTHWRGYVPASSLQGANLVTDLRFPDRPDEPVTRSVGQPPHVGEYAIDLPAAGTYHASIRYASPDSRPLRLFLNGVEVNQVCNVPTGGALARYQTWFTAGVFRLPRGRLHVRLLSARDFPYVSMLRFVRVD